MELKTEKCKSCRTLRKPSDYIYKEKKNKTCIKCFVKREQNKEYHKESAKNYNQEQKDLNPLKTKLRYMVYNSKRSDKKYERFYVEEEYISLDFLEGLYQSNKKCYYCKVLMTLTFNLETKDKDQITIQRINNDLPHIKSNIVYSCYNCNCNKYMEIDTYNKLIDMNNSYEPIEIYPIF